MNTIARWMNSATFGPEGVGGGEAPAPSGGGDGGGSPPPSTPSGGGGEAPSGATPAPSTTTPSPPSGEAGPSFNWDALGSTDDLDHVEIPAEPPPVGGEPKPPAPPPAQPVTPPPAQPTPTPPPAAQTQTPSEGSPEGRPLTASDPWRIAEGLEANRDAVIAHLAQAKFALSEADIKDLDTDVTVAVPRLLARVFLESQVSMQKFLAQAVPGMVKQFNTVSNANSEAERQFFSTHKALDINNPQHRATAVRIATVYRQANPGLPLQQLIAEVGPMVMAALQVNAPPAQPTVVASPAQSAAGAFRPAVNGGGGHSPAAQPANEWEGLGRHYDQ